MTPMNPTPLDVVAGALAVLCACSTASIAVYLGWQTRNWLYHMVAVGAGVVVVGVVGQHAPRGSGSGLFDASIALPFFHESAVTPITAYGLGFAAAGLLLVVLFERKSDMADVRGGNRNADQSNFSDEDSF